MKCILKTVHTHTYSHYMPLTLCKHVQSLIFLSTLMLNSKLIFFVDQCHNIQELQTLTTTFALFWLKRMMIVSSGLGIVHQSIKFQTFGGGKVVQFASECACMHSLLDAEKKKI